MTILLTREERRWAVRRVFNGLHDQINDALFNLLTAFNNAYAEETQWVVRKRAEKQPSADEPVKEGA